MKTFANILTQKPELCAKIKGSNTYPAIKGTVNFYKTNLGIIVSAKISGLPVPHDKCKSPVFAFHIHSENICTGNRTDPFKNAGTHLNLRDCPHPYHTGDLPPLFGAKDCAYSAFLTNRFTLEDIIGKAIIIHLNPDDFTTQPAGNSGTKIACGIIQNI